MGIAIVHVRSWQAAYRGLIPQDYLDSLDPAQRRPRWEHILSESNWPRAGTLVAQAAEDVIGFANICPTRDEDEDPANVGEHTSIYLLPTAWSTGSGRELMIAALGTLQQSFSQATLWVLDTNSRARRFYEAAGWQTDGGVKLDEVKGISLKEVRYRRTLP